MPRKELVGKVVSNKMEKTVVVAVENRFPHPKYEKQIVETRKFKAHDEENKCNVGDSVRIKECRPLSREKRWLVVEITERGIGGKVTEEAAI
ncbi:MAG TPA: 30S ribosomal protein S17 [Verrucomicrobiae bacterium]|nr:30S ribosomal protein S17 [Verrucomicrobiae bacterium]